MCGLCLRARGGRLVLSVFLFLIISSSCVVEEEKTEGVFRLRSKSARRLWYSGSVIVLVLFIVGMCC